MLKGIVLFVLFVVNFFLINAEEKTSTNSFPVGELGEAWDFPSDHLPIGGTIGNIHFAMWNILDTEALHHIVDNGQGLKDSYIMTANTRFDDLITVREAKVIENVLEMIQHEKYPRSLIALQETGKEVFLRLQEVLPSNMKLYPATVEEVGHGDIYIYDTNLFEVINIDKAYYKIRRQSTMMALKLREKKTGLIYNFMQSHVPGGPIFSAHARKELAEYVKSHYEPQAITILVGDMNRSSDFFIKNFEQVFENQPFTSMDIPYPTHINTLKEASWIDNIFIALPEMEIKVEVAESAAELFQSLQSIIDLLNSFR